MDADVQRLIDRQEIADLCVRYTFALDTKDWALLESCFTGAPTFVHPGGRLEGFEAILTRARGALESLDASQHLLGNVVADVDGDTARSTCYFQAQHVRDRNPGRRYLHHRGQLHRYARPDPRRLEDRRTRPGLPVARRQPRRRQAMSAPEAQPQGAPRLVVLAHGSLRHADFRDRVAAVARAGFDGLGLHVREYARLRSEGWSDADLRAVLTGAGLRLVEIETLLGWDDPPERRDPDGLRRERLAFALADAVGARHVVAVGAITGDLRPTATEGYAALCERAAEHGLLVALEPQACSSIADLATATAIVADAGRPNGGLNVDVWHQTRGGWPLSALRGLAPEQVVVIQVDDGPGRPITDDYLDECTRYRSAPGQGDFDLNGFLRALLATGTTAPVSVEVLSDENDQLPPATVAGALAMATRRVLQAAGVPTPPARQ